MEDYYKILELRPGALAGGNQKGLFPSGAEIPAGKGSGAFSGDPPGI